MSVKNARPARSDARPQTVDEDGGFRGRTVPRHGRGDQDLLSGPPGAGDAERPSRFPQRIVSPQRFLWACRPLDSLPGHFRRRVRKTPGCPEVGPTAAFYRCITTGMHGPTCIYWANLTPFSLGQSPRTSWRTLWPPPARVRACPACSRAVYFSVWPRSYWSPPPY